MRRLLSIIGSLINTLVTGGQFGSYVEGETPYEKRQRQKRSDIDRYGSQPCHGGCGTTISKLRNYCRPCYEKIKKS